MLQNIDVVISQLCAIVSAFAFELNSARLALWSIVENMTVPMECTPVQLANLFEDDIGAKISDAVILKECGTSRS